MTRRRHSGPTAHQKKGGGGLLMGMRSGVRSIAGQGSEQPSKRRSRVWNVITVLLVLATAVILLRRFGVLDF